MKLSRPLTSQVVNVFVLATLAFVAFGASEKKFLEKVNSLASSLSFIEQQSVSKSTKIVELANNFWETIASGRVWVKIIKPSV